MSDSEESWVVDQTEDEIEDQIVDVSPPPLSLSEAAERDSAYLITNGQLKTVQRCPRKWWLSWYRRLALRSENLLDVRATGTRIHRALQAYYVPDGETPTDPRDALERALVQDWTEMRRRAGERGLDEENLGSLRAEFD